jgi:hypothetical protein
LFEPIQILVEWLIYVQIGSQTFWREQNFDWVGKCGIFYFAIRALSKYLREYLQ